MIDSGRLRALMQERGISQAEMARRIGVTQGAIAKMVSNNPGGSSHLHRVARELGTTTAYLEGETDDASEGAIPVPTPERLADQLDLVGIAQIDAQYGMGETFLQHHIEQEVKYFPRDWVRAITDSPPEKLVWARGWGDSMAPTIQPTDLIMIDLSQTKVREQDVIWAAAVGDMGMIKRLRVRADGVTILSDNPNVSDDYATHDEIHIVGRVIFIGRRL